MKKAKIVRESNRDIKEKRPNSKKQLYAKIKALEAKVNLEQNDLSLETIAAIIAAAETKALPPAPPATPMQQPKDKPNMAATLAIQLILKRKRE